MPVSACFATCTHCLANRQGARAGSGLAAPEGEIEAARAGPRALPARGPRAALARPANELDRQGDRHLNAPSAERGCSSAGRAHRSQ